MTHCNLETIRFASLGSRKIEADFAGRRITTDTGVLLLREIDRRTGLIDALDNLIDALDKAIPDPRDPARFEHDQKTFRADLTLRFSTEQSPDDDAEPDEQSAFLANPLRLLLSGAAYVLRELLRRIGLKGTAMEQAQVGTIRLKLLKVASRVVVSVRRVVFHLSKSYPYRALFEQVLENLNRWGQATRASPK